MAQKYDFIVIGAGASGCVIASRLAETTSRPSVLLLEAGGKNETAADTSLEERFIPAFTPNSPMNWGYETTPQHQLIGQKIDYSRGKGLGGSTAINFCAWTVGARDDYDEWARRVGSDNFGWANVKRCLNKIESLHPDIPDPDMRRYVDPRLENHGSDGRLDIGYGEAWLPNLDKIYTAVEEKGLPVNPDVNSGNPIGMGMAGICYYNGRRGTSAAAYLVNPPSNLTTLPNSSVARIIFQGRKGVGIETTDGREFYARNEIILSAGAIGSPHILLLSGIGPKGELETHGVKVVLDSPLVGKNLQDHLFVPVGIAMKQEIETTLTSQSPTPMGWFKLPGLLASKEFEVLSESQKTFLQAPTVPHFEIATHNPPTFLNYDVPAKTEYLGAICLVMNPQSQGTITLHSSNPNHAPVIDPKFLSHPFDCRTIIEGVRQAQGILAAPVFAATTIETLGPKDNSDESILQHARETCRSSWHMSCTVMMGPSSDKACVDSSFRLFGIEGLRVADLSVCPFVTSNHTQFTAYVVGELASEALIKEYRLDHKASGFTANI